MFNWKLLSCIQFCPCVYEILCQEWQKSQIDSQTDTWRDQGSISQWFFLHYSNLMAIWFWCDCTVGYDISTKFWTCHDSTAAMCKILHQSLHYNLDESGGKFPLIFNYNGKCSWHGAQSGRYTHTHMHTHTKHCYGSSHFIAEKKHNA